MTISKRLRFAILERDGFTCRYCGRRPPDVTLEVDHVAPKSRGGSNHPSNLVAACYECNRGKRDLHLLDIHADCGLQEWTQVLELETRLDEAEQRIDDLTLTIDRLREDRGRHVPIYAADILRGLD